MDEVKDTVKKENQENGTLMSNKKQWLFILLFVVIAGISILSICMQMTEFSLSEFIDYIFNANPIYLLIAILCMLGFIFFEGFGIIALCRSMGYKTKKRKGYVYASADIYFSALTPSATGGQPASAYFMIKDGMNGMLVTAILIANLCMYTLAIVVLGFICFIIRFDYFLKYSLASQVLIILGFASQVLLVIFFYMVLKKDTLLQNMCDAVLRFLCKIKILRKYEEKREKLFKHMEKYRKHSHYITGHPVALLKCFFFNLLQRASQIMVCVFVYAATISSELKEAFEVFFWQGFSVLGSNLIPVPGGMGISDHIMLDGFKNIMDESTAVKFELLSRSFSFYSCVIICGISFFVCYSLVKKRERTK